MKPVILLLKPFRGLLWLAKNIAKKIKTVIGYLIQAKKRRKDSYYILMRRYAAIRPKTILWEAFYGRGMVDNPYALFSEMIRDPAYADYRHIWVLDNLANHAPLIAEYHKHKNVRFVEFQSYAYLRALATAQYLVNNVTFWQYFIKRPGQVYINTWHGIPLKHIGADENRAEGTNMVRNFLHADYLLSTNAFLSTVYKKAFLLGSLFQGEIIEEGYPRLDALVSKPQEAVRQKLRSHGVALDDRAIILYAPTWRGAYNKPTVEVEAYLKLKETLERRIDTSRYQVLIKPHQVVYNAARKAFDTIDCMVPADIDASEVLSVTDVLISDYSSIFYDFLATNRPILFYIPDLLDYAQSRGLYATPDTLPGPFFESPEALAEGVAHLEASIKPYADTYAQQRTWASVREPGTISATVLAHLFQGAPARLAPLPSKKKTLVFFADSLRVNGITSSLINLLNALDAERYDITLFTAKDKNSDLTQVDAKLKPHIRLLYRKATYGRTLWDDLRLHVYKNRGFRTRLGRLTCPWHYCTEEVVRYFGNATIDCAIDFVGFSLFFATLALATKANRHLIWTHSDMEAEQRTRMRWLPKLFSAYPKFDALVSCCPALCEQNAASLTQMGFQTTFASCRNIVFTERVLTGLASSRLYTEGEKQWLLLGALDLRSTSIKAIPLFTVDAKAEIISHPLRFIMVGRLSPEKNYAATLQAFAQFVKVHEAAVLYIVGAGPLQKQLQRLISELNLEQNAFLVGLVDNPAELMAHCDCFVLTSLYEGQPMVIHEARTAHMPIIMSTFSSCRDAMVDEGQYLVEPTEDSILEGFKAFTEGRVPKYYAFTPEAYNREVLAQFDALTSPPPPSEIYNRC